VAATLRACDMGRRAAPALPRHAARKAA